MKIKFEHWTIQRIEAVLPTEFFQLIEDNKTHIGKTFPVTLSNCIDLEKTKAFLEKSKRKENDQDGFHFYIRNQETQKLIGYVCIKNINKSILKCELAYFIDNNFEGRGIISKAVSQTIDFCFKQLNMNKVYICTSKINTKSQRIATKHGFQQEGILREEFKSGTRGDAESSEAKAILEDIVYFGLLKSEYQSYER